MKYFLSIILLTFWTFLFAQKNECGFGVNGGLSVNNNLPKNPSTIEIANYRKAYGINDFGLSLSYQRVLWKRFSLNLSSEVQFSRMQYVFPIVDWYESYQNLENRYFSQNRLNYRIGLRKSFFLMDSSFAIQLGVDLVYRQYLNEENTYSSGEQKKDWVGYTYEVNTYAGSYYYNDQQLPQSKYYYLNMEYQLGIKLPLKNRFSLSINLNYSRNHYLFYNYKNEFYYYTNGSTTPSYSITDSGIQGNFNPKFVVRDHFLYLQTGASYSF